MKALGTGSLPLALSGIIALVVGGIGGLERLQAANPFANGLRQDENVATPGRQTFGGRGVPTAPRQRLRRSLPAPQPLQLRGAKPFEKLHRSPILSPYHNLDVLESGLGLPNYHAFVRPMQQQQLANQAQAANLRKLQQRLRVATAQGIVSNNPSGGVPTTGNSAQFLNLGGYFPDAR